MQLKVSLETLVLETRNKPWCYSKATMMSVYWQTRFFKRMYSDKLVFSATEDVLDEMAVKCTSQPGNIRRFVC